jgi:hypothetical protein
MSVIQRNTTRTILNSTETTAKTDTVNSSVLAFNLLTTDLFYIGFKKPFASRYFNLSVLNVVAATLSVKYWDGTDWESVEDLIDQTSGFTKSGFLSWQNQNDWRALKLAPISDVEHFWIQISVSANLTTETALQSVSNLFCDDNLLRAYYPELVTDARYLPSGRTDFMEQMVAAKDLVVTRLKQDHLIKDESEVLDINEVAISATHATAWIILNPIARSDGEKEMRNDAFAAFNRELNKVKLSLDLNNSGVIELQEEHEGDFFVKRG